MFEMENGELVSRDVGYGLRHPKLGLVRCVATRDCDGEMRHALSLHPDDPLLFLAEVRDLERLVNAPARRLGGCEPREAAPAGVDVAACEPVQLTLETKARPVRIPTRLKIERVVETREIPRGLAERYTGARLDFLDKPILVIADLAYDVAFADLAAFVGAKACQRGHAAGRIVHAVGPVPEDYADLVGGNAALLVCGTLE